MATIDANELLNRFCALELEASGAAGVSAQGAMPRFVWQQETFPYWINTIIDVTEEKAQDGYGEEIAVYAYRVWSRLLLANVTAGYSGENDQNINLVLPELVEYLDARELLQSASYPVAMLNIRYSELLSCTGFKIFPPGPSGSQMAGIECFHRVTFDKLITQAYL